MTSQDIFNNWVRAFESDPQAWSRLASDYRWTVSGPGGGSITLSCQSRPRATIGAAGPVDCEISIAENDFVKLISGELNPQAAFLEKRIKLKAKTKYALRLNFLLESLIDFQHRYAEPGTGSAV